jgi:hypothetical protein
MLRLLLAILVLNTVTVRAQDGSGGWGEPRSTDGGEEARLPDMTPPPPPEAGSAVDEVLQRSGADLLAMPSVVGVSSGLAPDGAAAVLVWVTDAQAAEGIPKAIEGYPVVVHVVPEGFTAYPTP